MTWRALIREVNDGHKLLFGHEFEEGEVGKLVPCCSDGGGVPE